MEKITFKKERTAEEFKMFADILGYEKEILDGAEYVKNPETYLDFLERKLNELVDNFIKDKLKEYKKNIYNLKIESEINKIIN